MNKAEVIIVRGASCTGKSTLANLIRKNKKGVCIEIDSVRFMINGVDWYNNTQYYNSIDITFELILHFLELKYKPIYILDTFPRKKVQYFIEKVKQKNISFVVYSLFLQEDELLERLKIREGEKLNQTYINVAQKQNQDILNEQFLASLNHYFIDTTDLQPLQLLNEIYREE